MYKLTQKIIQEKRLKKVYPGVVSAFITADKEEVFASGLSQVLPEKHQMTIDKLFDVASLTKVVCTTTVLLKLWEAKKIDWDMPLKSYLPAFKNEDITLRHLLTHTSDIQTWIENRDQLDASQLRQAYLTLAPGDLLGKKVQYTDAGTILLGFMLEEIYQKPVVEIFQQEVLQPLDMQHSFFQPTKAKKKNIVPTEKLATGVLQGVTHDPKARVLGAHAGNAGLFTDISDLMRFCRLFLSGGKTANGERFLQPETIEMLLKDQTPTRKQHRSLGWDLRPGKYATPALFHTGYTGTLLFLDVAAKEAWVFLSNRLHPVDLRAEYLKERDEILATYQKERGVH